MNHFRAAVLASLYLSLIACGKPAESPSPGAPSASTASAPAAGSRGIDASISSDERLDGDREEDAWRKPAQVLEFLQVKPGMRVADYFAGGGYYTELLSRIVGEEGQVIAYNNAAYLNYAQEKPGLRYGDNRLPNVVEITAPPEEAPLAPDSLDRALFVQSYHDLYWRPKDDSWRPTDPVKSLATLVPALKSGAMVVVIDHVATPGADPLASVDKTHRIDPAIVKRDFEAAGLVFDADSAMFSNPKDDHTLAVFDPSIRRSTDQFVYRFRKP